MEILGAADAHDDPERVDLSPEMEHRLNTLRSLVCDLLKTNQELRLALLKTTSGAPDHQDWQHPTADEKKKVTEATL